MQERFSLFILLGGVDPFKQMLETEAGERDNQQDQLLHPFGRWAMPIRFRCVYCTRLLGIASRKAGSATRCPQCGNEIVVPLRSEDEVEATQSAEPPRFSAPLGSPPQPAAVASADPKGKVKSPSKPNDEPLFIGDDIDDLLGLPRQAKAAPPPASGPKPVNGMDAMSLEEEKPGAMVITPQKMTLIVVALALLLMLTFAAGMFLGMNTTRSG